MDEDINRILNCDYSSIDMRLVIENVPEWLVDFSAANQSKIYIDTDNNKKNRNILETEMGFSVMEYHQPDIQPQPKDIYLQCLEDQDSYNDQNLDRILNQNFSFLLLVFYCMDDDKLIHSIDNLELKICNRYHCVDYHLAFAPILPSDEISDSSQYALMILHVNSHAEQIRPNLLQSMKSHINLYSQSLSVANKNFSLIQEFDGVSGKLELLNNSTIWKATQPLRKALDHGRHLALSSASMTLASFEFCKTLIANYRSPDRKTTWFSQAKFLNFLETCRKNYDGVFILAAPVGWDITLIQRPHHLCRALTQSGFLVVYLSPNKWRDRVIGYNEVSPGLFITLDRELLEKINGAYVSFCSTSSAYPPGLIEKVRNNGNKVIYEYIDHIDPKISGTTVDDLMSIYNYVNTDTIDFVFASSEALVREINQNVHESKILFVPNAVDTDHYISRLEAKTPPPQAIENVIKQNKPVVGYFGAIAPWLWYDLLNELITNCPQYNFVFIGPDYFDSEKLLPKAENFFNLGSVNYAELPDFAQHFDIGIIPFAPGKISQTTSPLKLFEYFALQKPVVVTHDMHECTVYDEVLPARDLTEYMQQISHAIELSRQQDFQVKLQKLALDNTWKKRAEKIHRLML